MLFLQNSFSFFIEISLHSEKCSRYDVASKDIHVLLSFHLCLGDTPRGNYESPVNLNMHDLGHWGETQADMQISHGKSLSLSLFFLLLTMTWTPV